MLMTRFNESASGQAMGRAGFVKRDNVHFSNRMPERGFGNDSDVQRIFILNFICASGLHAQGEYLVFDVEDFKAHE
jgi:hypothetical protein